MTSIGFDRFHPCRTGMNKKGSVKRGVVPVRGVALLRCWTQMKGSYLPSGEPTYPTKREKESYFEKVPPCEGICDCSQEGSQNYAGNAGCVGE